MNFGEKYYIAIIFLTKNQFFNIFIEHCESQQCHLSVMEDAMCPWEQRKTNMFSDKLPIGVGTGQ